MATFSVALMVSLSGVCVRLNFVRPDNWCTMTCHWQTASLGSLTRNTRPENTAALQLANIKSFYANINYYFMRMRMMMFLGKIQYQLMYHSCAETGPNNTNDWHEYTILYRPKWSSVDYKIYQIFFCAISIHKRLSDVCLYKTIANYSSGNGSQFVNMLSQQAYAWWTLYI